VHEALDPPHRGLARTRLHEIAREHQRASLERLASAVLSAALEHSGLPENADDFVVLALRYAPQR
jgi:serine phosphatase RsbU (regulator of sigma subunit)